jgi:hypothetical protein
MNNQNTKRVTFIILLALIMSVFMQASIAAAEASTPVNLSFAKADPDGDFIWHGTVSGDISGSLETRLLSISQAGKILHVEFDWIVDAGEQSFTARLKGTLDSETGSVTMNGTVIEGYLAGAQVHEQGQLVNPATSGFEGTIRLMPASAD